MKRIISLLLVATISTPIAMFASSDWSYSGATGPANWAKLTDHNDCAGKNQSPIDVSHLIEADLPPLELSYHEDGFECINNGHTVQVNFPTGNTFTLDHTTYSLKQFHFHASSEHTVDGKSYPLEAHFVHADREGHLAVIGLLFTEGQENETLAHVWEVMPHKAGESAGFHTPVSAASLLPEDLDYYRYNGSLTTPPCTEGVRWILLKHTATASVKQIHEIEELLHHPNNRPVQPANARPILK